jgi:CheY-like chemotaxis protein
MKGCKNLHFESDGLAGINYIKRLIEKNAPLPQIILLAVHMPVLDGFEFIERFHGLDTNETYNTQIIFISPSVPRIPAHFIHEIRYISKPVNSVKLSSLFHTVKSNQNVYSAR